MAPQLRRLDGDYGGEIYPPSWPGLTRPPRLSSIANAVDAGAGMGGWTYILASQRNGTLYVGVTSDIITRTWQHREGIIPGFTKTYGVKMLVWYERHDDIQYAIRREHNLKHWSRAWKLTLIERGNPDWRDLWDEIASPMR